MRTTWPIKHQFNRRFFAVIDSEEKAYWAGFLLADGCVKDDGTVQLRLSDADRSHVEAFASVLDSATPIRLDRTPDGRIQPTLRVFSKAMVGDLATCGVVPRKTHGHPLPTSLPGALVRHFVRGYFDGDGCVSLHGHYSATRIQFRLSVCGHRLFLEWLREQMRVAVLDLRGNLRALTGIWMFTIGGNRQVATLARWMYENSTVRLDRKARAALGSLTPPLLRAI